MSVPHLKLNKGDGIAVMFKDQPYNPTPVTITNNGTPVMVMKVAEIEGVFVEWIRFESNGDPVGVVFTDLNDDTYCLPLAMPEDRGGVYVKKLHDGAIEALKATRAAIEEAQKAAQEKASGPPAVVLAHSVPGVDKSQPRR